MRVEASLGAWFDLGHPHVSLITPGGVDLKHRHASHRLRRHNRSTARASKKSYPSDYSCVGEYPNRLPEVDLLHPCSQTD